MASTSEDENEEERAQLICDRKVSGKRGRPRLTFKHTVSKILEEGDVNNMRTARRAYM